MFKNKKPFMLRKPSDFIPEVYRVEGIHLDFGCGTQPRNPFQARNLLSVDIYRTSAEIPSHEIQIGDTLPFNDETFSSVSAYDVMEHLSRDSVRGNDFIFYMQEIYRVLKPGGVAVIIFPAFPHRDAFSDPTHINFITSHTIDYFLGNKNGPYYAGITTNFSAKANHPLRSWGKWLPLDSQSTSTNPKNLRRSLSLAKRDFLRFIRPQHRIWVLSKES